MGIENLINYCCTNSEIKWATAEALLKSKRYADCLFFCHLSLELLLKGKVVVMTQKAYPVTHDLEYLIKKAKITINKKQKKDLAIINTFNIAGRYDDIKLSFYKKVTKEMCLKYFLISRKLRLWLKNQSAR